MIFLGNRNHTVPDDEKLSETPGWKKPYIPPTLTPLDAETGISMFEAAARAGDTEAQKILQYVREIEKAKRAQK